MNLIKRKHSKDQNNCKQQMRKIKFIWGHHLQRKVLIKMIKN